MFIQGMPSHDFHFRGQTYVTYVQYKHVLKRPLRQDIFKETYQNVVFRDNILLQLYLLYIREFKHLWYQIYKADYCLKHFKLVYSKVHKLPASAGPLRRGCVYCRSWAVDPCSQGHSTPTVLQYRVVCPNFRHPALTSSFTKYKILQVINSFSIILNEL